MKWVPWIHTEPEETSQEDVSQLYQQTRHPMSGKISDLVRLTSLTPDVSRHVHHLGATIYRHASGLTAREKEIAALVTSSFTGCVH
jgi:alkylhydroperoxidase family enzyme